MQNYLLKCALRLRFLSHRSSLLAAIPIALAAVLFNLTSFAAQVEPTEAAPRQQEDDLRYIAELEAKVASLEAENAALREKLKALTQTNEQLQTENRLTKVASPGRERTAIQRSRVQTIEDEATKQTILTTEWEPLKEVSGSRATHFLQAVASPISNSPSKEQLIRLTVLAQETNDIYKHVDTASLSLTLLDPEQSTTSTMTLTLPITERERESRKIGGARTSSKRLIDETLHFDIAGEQFNQITQASAATLTLGRVSIEMNLDQIALLRALNEERLKPASP